MAAVIVREVEESRPKGQRPGLEIKHPGWIYGKVLICE